MQPILLQAISELDEKQLTLDIVIPLIEKTHPGRIEYTHSPNEAGRDIVSFGTDLLNRPHILCVQVKAKQISYAAAAFGKITSTARTAKEVGVVTETGQTCYPHEVWFITSHPFPEQKRRQVAGSIEALERDNIKFVSGEEICKLMMEHLPDIAAGVSKCYSPEIMVLISSLFKHREGRAFGFSNDRNIDEFYVTATLSPQAVSAFDALAGKIIVESLLYGLYLTSNKILEFFVHKCLGKADVSGKKLLKYLKNLRSMGQEELMEIITNCALELIPKQEYIDEFAVAVHVLMDTEEDFSEVRKKIIEDSDLIISDPIILEIELNLAESFRNLLKETKEIISKCPKTLDKDVSAVRKTCDQLGRVDRFIKWVRDDLDAPCAVSGESVSHPIRVRIPKLEYLPRFDRFLLIDGEPGCGKTTLLRMLSINILSRNGKALYVPCCAVAGKYEKKSLGKIARAFCQRPISREWKNQDCLLILDGMDEAPFDLTDHIIRSMGSFSGIIASTRSAFKTKLRGKYYQLGLAPFTKRERDSFLGKWFKNQPHLIEKAQQLVTKSPDIDLHTRLPLIATIVVSLLQSGFTPKTRAEIYDLRLLLLLSKWDQSRGVSRLYIDDPDAKRRFLRELAYHLHSSEKRRRTIEKDELSGIYEAALGNWGYMYDFSKLLDDLIVGSGVISEEQPGLYSLGHLTFQEHLAGEYIAQNLSLEDISLLLGDDWWREALIFYASIKGNINELIEYLMENEEFHSHAGQLSEMVFYAPYTSPGAVDCLKTGHIDKDDPDRGWHIS